MTDKELIAVYAFKHSYKNKAIKGACGQSVTLSGVCSDRPGNSPVGLDRARPPQTTGHRYKLPEGDSSCL